MLQGFEKNRTFYFGVIGPEISIFLKLLAVDMLMAVIMKIIGYCVN